MVNNSQFGNNTNDLNILTEILKQNNESLLKKYLKKSNFHNIILQDIIKINSLKNNFTCNIKTFSLSPFYNSFLDNRKIFFYLLNNYNYDFEGFISYLLKKKQF